MSLKIDIPRKSIRILFILFYFSSKNILCCPIFYPIPTNRRRRSAPVVMTTILVPLVAWLPAATESRRNDSQRTTPCTLCAITAKADAAALQSRSRDKETSHKMVHISSLALPLFQSRFLC